MPVVSKSLGRGDVMSLEEFKEWLLRFDVDGDDRISREELRMILRQAGENFIMFKSKQGIKKADADRDGFIDNSEMKNLVEFAKKRLGITVFLD